MSELQFVQLLMHPHTSVSLSDVIYLVKPARRGTLWIYVTAVKVTHYEVLGTKITDSHSMSLLKYNKQLTELKAPSISPTHSSATTEIL
jgi:hypothetical protein